MSKEMKLLRESREQALHCCDRFFNSDYKFSPMSFEEFLYEQSRYRSGTIIPEIMDLDVSSDSGFFFGTTNKRNAYIGKPANQDGHILVTGTPGSYKSTGIVMPTLMTWRGSQVILDVKGDMRDHWRYANSYHSKKLLVFSPGSEYSCRYDPFSALRRGNLAGHARDLAMALIPLPASVNDPVWIQTAQNFLTAAIIYHFETGCSFVDTMVELQNTPVVDMIREVVENGSSVAKSYMTLLQGVQEKVLSNIGMEISNLVSLVADLAIMESLSPAEEVPLLDWEILNTSVEPVDVILEIPETCLDRWKPVVVLMLNQLVKTLEQRPSRTYKKETELPPLLILLDEFQRLGKVSSVTNGLATLRSRGVTFALVIQSIGALDDTYGTAASRVIADLCHYKAVLAVSDPTSQKYFSDLVGTTVTMQRGFSATHDSLSGVVSGYNRTLSETREPIIHPHEFLTLQDVVLITPHGFCRANKTPYFKCAASFLRLLRSTKSIDADIGGYSYAP